MIKRILSIVGLVVSVLFIPFLFNNCSSGQRDANSSAGSGVTNSAPAGSSCTPRAVPSLMGVTASSTFKVKISRYANTQQFDVVVESSTQIVNPSEFSISTDNGTTGAVLSGGTRTVRARVNPSQLSQVTTITVTRGSESVQKEVLVFNGLDQKWEMPEPVPGLVNTLGWEDSPEISRDGEHLIIGTYSPVSLFCCISADPSFCPVGGTQDSITNPACNISRGPYTGPERPNMFGAGRITNSSTISNAIPELGISADGTARPPVASYGFQIQTDGSFASPYPIGWDWNGNTWGAPFGFNFADESCGNVRRVYFAAGDHLSPSTMNDLFFSTINLGAINFLGAYRFDGMQVYKQNFISTLVNVERNDIQSNPFYSSDLRAMFWDSEHSVQGTDLWVADQSANGSFINARRWVGSTTGRSEYQPYFFNDRLYFSEDHYIIRSRGYLGGNISQIGSWEASEVSEIMTDPYSGTRVGGISAIGEPSFAVDASGGRWMYFAYAVRRNFGLDLNIARVRWR